MADIPNISKDSIRSLYDLFSGAVAGVSAKLTAAPAILPVGTSRSGTITTGGTSQVLAAANPARTALSIQNIDATEDLWFNETGGAAVVAGAGSYLIPAKVTMKVSTQNAISVIAATTGHKFTATEG